MKSDFFDLLPREVVENAKNIDLKIRSVNAHEAIDAILNKSVLLGGKRLRPLLTYLVGHLFNIESELLKPYARATELVHAASLSHDDVIDNATMRRGNPSINILSSNKKAVLAGDYLLSTVIVDLSMAGHLKLVQEMSLVIKDLSEGEWLQLDLIESRAYTRELIREVAAKKTSSVMSYCSLAPAVLWGKSHEVEKLCSRFGFCLGLAFQLIDDTFDFDGDSQKDTALDLQNGIVNSVVFEYLNQNPAVHQKFLQKESLESLVKDVDMTSYVEMISGEAHQHLGEAKKILQEIKTHLINDYQNREAELDKKIEALEFVVDFMGMRSY